MSPRQLRPADPVVAAYTRVLLDLEALILARVPTLPLLPRPSGLTAAERDQIAQRLADAARAAVTGDAS